MPRCFNKQIDALQTVLSERLAVYEKTKRENARLRQQEAALLSRISSTKGGVAALQTAALQTAASASSAGTGAGGEPAAGGGPANPLLEKLGSQELAIQALLQFLGVQDNYEALYTSRLLRALAADPAKQQILTKRTTAEALKILAGMAKTFSMLLLRYDDDGPMPTGWNAKQQLDNLVDRAIEGTLFRGLMEFPRRNTAWLSTNMETMQPEPYPPGWFKLVAKALDFSPEQKAKLRCSWERGAADKAKLLARYEQVAAKLEQLQQQQMLKCEAFCRQAASVEDKCARSAALLQQQRTSRRSASSASSASGSRGSSGLTDQGLQCQTSAASSSSSASTALYAADELLCVAGGSTSEQKQLEAEQQGIVCQLNLLFLVQGMQIYNTATRKQLAAGVVCAYPFAPDPIAVCEAFNALGW